MSLLCLGYKMIHTFLSGKLLQIYASLAATFSVLSYSVGHSWASPAIAKLRSNESSIHITSVQSSWITSIEMITIPISAICSIYLLKFISSRTLIFIQTLPLLICWLSIAFATNIYYFYISRVMVGIGDGLIFLSVPIYISEISEPKIRGALMCLLPGLYCVGSIYTSYLAYSLSITTFAYVSIAIPIINFLLALLMPQSPYYLIYNNEYEKGKEVLGQLRPKGYDINTEFENIRLSLEEQKRSPGSLKEFICNPVVRKATYVVGWITFFEQVAGVQTIGSYLHLIVEGTDLDLNVEDTAAIFGVISLLTSMLMVLFIDNQGRRILLMISCLGTALGMFLLSMFFYFKNINSDLGSLSWLALISLYSIVFFYHIGLADIALIMAGELYPTSMKNYGTGFASSVYGLMGFVTNKLFQIIADSLGVQYIFWMFSASALVGFFYTYFFVPETTKKSLEEIQIMLSEVKKKKAKGTKENNA